VCGPGLPVLDEGTAAVIKALGEAGVLLMEERYAHKYPYDWRTKLPTIFRATPQARPCMKWNAGNF
jgi:isoleucyl-tRNA synthetase